MAAIRALAGKVIVSNMKKGERKVGGIILRNDDGKEHGVRPRWAQVHALGKGVTGIEVGNWVYVSHGRWTRPFFADDDNGEPVELFEVERQAMIMVSESEPEDDYVVDTYVHSVPQGLR